MADSWYTEALMRTMRHVARTYQGLPVLSFDGDDVAVFANGNASYLKDGLTVYGHGDEGGISFKVSNVWVGPITGAELAQFLKTEAPYTLDRIRRGGLLVVACSTGGTGSHFGRDLSKALGDAKVHVANVLLQGDGTIAPETARANVSAGWLTYQGDLSWRTDGPARLDRVSREDEEPVALSLGAHRLGSMSQLQRLLEAETAALAAQLDGGSARLRISPELNTDASLLG